MMRSLMLAAALSCAPIFAFGQTYDCTVADDKAGGNWFGDRIIVQLSQDGKAKVNSAHVQEVYGGPIDAKVDTNNDRRLTVRWKVDGLKDVTGQYAPKLAYSWTIMKADKSARGSMQASGYGNSFQTNGKCK